jgi:hypothetical protein
MILIFQNAFEGNATDSIAINSKQVISVYEQDVLDPTDKKGKKTFRVTTIYTLGDTAFSVKDDFLDVIARLNNV